MTMRFFNYAIPLLSLLTFSQDNVNAQDKPAPLPLMIPPSPNAAALGEYGKVPVGLFTGTIQQNIPLYTIETGGFSFPLSLNYQSNGVKVTDVGSNVGLGWTLDAGGIITRTVNDETDEYGSTQTSLPTVDFNTQQMSDYLKQATSDNNWDSEPDLFAFNFAGYSGKFYLSGAPGNMQAVLIAPTALKISFLPNFYSNSLDGEQIVITDPAGIVYTFGGSGANAIEESNSKTYGSGGPNDNPQSKIVKTAWNLTKIKLVNGDEIKFTYAYKSLRYDGGISQTIPAAISFKPSTGFYVENAIHTLPKVTSVNIQSCKLTEINWKNGKVALTYSLRFTGGLTDFEKIDNLSIYSKNGTTLTMLKQYGFSYQTVNTGYPNPDNLNGNYIDASRRLFLSALIAKSSDGTELNRYSFDYFNPDQLPNRLSYAQDYWGHFNGKSNPDLVTNDVYKYNPDYYQSTGVFSQDMIKQLFKNVGGDKNADEQFAIKGMLQKVTYPTGGYSTFEYESHTTGKMEDVYPAKTEVYLHQSDPATGAEVTSYTTGVIPFTQQAVELFPGVSGNDCIKDANQVNYEIKFIDLTTNTAVPIKVFDGVDTVVSPTPYRVVWNDIYVLHKKYFFTFVKGKTYNISSSLLRGACASAYGQLKLSFYAQNITQQWINRPVGGVRIKRISTSDLTGNTQVKRYHYGSDLNNLDRSTGKIRLVEPGINYFESLSLVQNNGVSEELRILKVHLHSAPLHDLNDAQGYHISYSTVIEINGNNMEGGAIVHNFNSVMEVPPIHYRDPVMGTPFENVFGNGEEVKTTIYKNVGTFVRVSETNRTYTNDNRIATSVAAFRATKRSLSYINSAETYNLSIYSIKSQWRHLSSSSEIMFDQSGNNGSTISHFYDYHSPVHLQLTATSTVLENAGTSNQRGIYVRSFYPTDYSFPGTLTPTASVIKSMAQDKHIWNSPIEQLKYTVIGGSFRLINSSLSTYKLNGGSIAKDKDYAMKFNNSTIYQDLISVTPASINSSGQFVYDSHYEQLNAYNRYDAANNLLELTDRNATSCVILQPNTETTWAKVENCTYGSAAYSSFEQNNSISSAFTNWNYNVANIIGAFYQSGTRSYNLNGANITTIQSLSSSQKYKVSLWRKIGSGSTLAFTAGSTLTQTLGPQRNEWQYIEATFTGASSLTISGNYIIDELRLHPVNARMTSFVYKDGVGVTSQCNENNQHTFFEYDEFNRLKMIKDQDGNILKKNQYKYQYIQN
jgi:hypothetical protein